MSRLAGKVVLVTGASSGIGRAAAERFASLGARVVLASRSAETLDEVRRAIVGAGGQALAIPTDVTDAAQVESAVAQTVATYGQLDVLLASAGLSLRAYFENTTLDTLERVMRVNFFGTLYATHHALPHVIRTRGSLVALSSLTGKRGIPSYALYGASKFAIQGLYEALRLEVKRHGVHVGVVSPAFVATPLRVNVLAGDGKPWASPPDPPFRIWPVEKCVDRIVRLVERRQKEAVIPGFVPPLLKIDDLMGRFLGDRILLRKFPPEAKP